MTGNDQRRFALGLVVFLVVFALAATIAEARRGLPQQLTLARAAVGECDWHMPDCHAAVWHTLRRRWVESRMARPEKLKHYSMAKQFFQYCSVFKGPHRGRNRWVRGLRADAKKPAGWPHTADWGVHLMQWKLIYQRAGEFRSGKVADPCDGEPTHTGGLMDAKRMDSATHRGKKKWCRVDCGETKRGQREQLFWERCHEEEG